VRPRTITVTGSTPQTNVVRNVVRETFTVEQAREAMGIDWMSMKTLSQAIPPAYSEFIVRHVAIEDRARKLEN
jgi:DNA (cytosine-5)-methyltransferase 1